MLEVILIIIYIPLTLAVGLALRQVWFAWRHFTPPTPSQQAKAGNLPSVTVCIPARNETHAMSDCLESVLDSTYPKLEIIVLDDSSLDDTSNLIKSFAHSGVRFVSGQKLPTGWLGKNFALEGLLQEASGSLVLFLDVDTRLRPQTIGQLVSYMDQEGASMVSVLPRREDGWRWSVLLSPLRYFWEIMFHRVLAPPAASNAWMIKRQDLLDYGSFASLKDAIKPESHLSAYFAHRDRYRFLVGTRALGLSYEKKWRSQLATSSRLLYPLLGGQWAPALIVMFDLALLLVPLLALLYLGPALDLIYVLYALLLHLAFSLLYAMYTKRVWSQGWWLAAVIWPIIVLQEIVLIVASYIMYQRKIVTWKGRPIRSEVQN